MQAYELRNAGAVIHSHSISTLLATLLDPDSNEFKVTHIEMIKVRWDCSSVGQHGLQPCFAGSRGDG
jgi:ribulose-5-phosphate 4-epimerase/fuculose-1-phosphate aldolase